MYQVFEGPDNGSESGVRQGGCQDVEQMAEHQRIQLGWSEIKK